MRKAVSVTLDEINLLWLRGRAIAAKGSLSEVLDRIVTRARQGGDAEPRAIRSVRGTIDFPDDDESLAEMDAFVRKCFDESFERTSRMLRETPPAYRPRRPRRRKAR
jgi:hypothetical protein